MGRDWKDALYPLKNTVIFIEENNEFIFTKEFASYVKESDMIKIMKGNIARQMFLAHPELKKELWGGQLWNPSYCAVTVSDRSRYVLTSKGKKKNSNLNEHVFIFVGRRQKP